MVKNAGDVAVEHFGSASTALLVGKPYSAEREESVKTRIHNLFGLDKRFL
jgi:hypothetical protein